MRILVIEDNRDILANVLDYLELKGYLVDCAQDALVLSCRPAGPTCHTGAPSCFYRRLEGDVLQSVKT